jgi:hypothetical protein
MRTHWTSWAAVSILFPLALAAPRAMGNGGPFVVKYPGGDPAAKGVLARLDPSLKPAEETSLRVIQEDLTISFVPELGWTGDKRKQPPLVDVTATYRIENPTGRLVQRDFGFPILRGIFLKTLMVQYPDVLVHVGEESAHATVISNSAIYGLIRQQAGKVIEEGIAKDTKLASLTARVRGAWTTPQPVPHAQESAVEQEAGAEKKPARKPSADYPAAREALREYLTTGLGWNARDAALLVEYASLELAARGYRSFGIGGTKLYRWIDPPRDRWDPGTFTATKELAAVTASNLGPLAAIGEQKATQLFAQLASRFENGAGSTYEAIFAAWGGDVRERAVDLESGEVRPREVDVPAPKPIDRNSPDLPPEVYDQRLTADPTVYARIDYLDPQVSVSGEEKASCQAILKNLPVVFTFAPMNLLHYRVNFPAHSTRTVTVTYRQHAYADTRGSGSYQLAYVLHPATLWKEFGPIRVTVNVPKGIPCKASPAIHRTGEKQAKAGLAIVDRDEWEGPGELARPAKISFDVYRATLAEPEQKRGELFIGIDKAGWEKMFPPAKPEPAPAVPPSANEK